MLHPARRIASWSTACALGFLALVGCLGSGGGDPAGGQPWVDAKVKVSLRDRDHDDLRAGLAGGEGWVAARPGGGRANAEDIDSVVTWVSRFRTPGGASPNLVLSYSPHPLQVWVNGRLVHRWSDPDADVIKVDFRSHAIPLDQVLVDRGSWNQIVVQVHPAGGTGRLPNLRLEPHLGASRMVWVADLLNFVLPCMVAASGLYLGVLILLLYFYMGRERPARLWFSGTSALFGLAHLQIMMADESLPARWPWVVSRTALVWAVLAVLHFVIHQSGRPGLSRRLLPPSLLAASVVALLFLSAENLAELEERFRLVSMVVVVPALVAGVGLSTWALKEHRTPIHAWTFLGVWGCALLGGHDLTVYISGVLPDAWWHPAGFLWLDFCLALAVSMDFAEAWRQNRQRAADLEFALHGQREERLRAEQAVRTRNRFLQQMAHQFRTPLQGLSGALELGPGAVFSTETLRGLEHHLRSHLAHINDVIDRIDLEAGRLESHPQSFQLHDLVGEWRTHPVFGGEGERRLPLRVMALVRADRDRIDRVARAFCARLAEQGGDIQGEVDLRAGALMLELWGLEGISAALAVDEDHLDLAVAHELLPHLRARLEFPARDRVRLTFPVEVLEDVPASATPDRERPLVVLAEDDRVNARILTALLEGAGCRVVHAPDGVTAVELVQATSPRMVVMDVMMPRMDGMEATRRIRRSGGAVSMTPIVGVTAHAGSAECLASGMNEMLAKPVRGEHVRDVVRRYCGVSR